MTRVCYEIRQSLSFEWFPQSFADTSDAPLQFSGRSIIDSDDVRCATYLHSFVFRISKQQKPKR